MKKLLSIIVLGLLLSGCATAPSLDVQNTLIKDGNIKLGMEYKSVQQVLGVTLLYDQVFYKSKNWKHMYAYSSHNFCSKSKYYSFEHINPSVKRSSFRNLIGSKIPTDDYKLTKIWDDLIPMIDYYINLSNSTIETNVLSAWKARNIEFCSKQNNIATTSNIIDTPDIEFTIKDKKEQCTAIGFEPATEKFADCVLRLVELDVKSQQATQIALAQSQGNQQVAEQLKKQNNSQSSDAFINLGLKLLSPQSTVSAPTTTNCRVIGSGAYKTVNCW